MIAKDMLYKSTFNEYDDVMRAASLFFTNDSKAYHIIFNLYIGNDYIGTVSKFEDGEPILCTFEGFDKLTDVRKSYARALFGHIKTIFTEENFINAYNKIF